MKKIYLIGEIGINHNGDIAIAKKLIDLAKYNGFDAVKFQKRSPEITTPKNKAKEIRITPWGNLSYLDYKKKLEFEFNEFKQIDKYCKKKKIDWFASVWDLDSLKLIEKFKPKYHKVPSAMLTNLKLLEKISKKKRKTFISTGMSDMKDVYKAVKIFKKNKCPFVLFHSVSIYPCDLKDLNLKMIETLKSKFKCDVGYSGHEVNVSPSLIAACLGANYIERHITLDRTMWGTDQSASLGPEGMRMLRILIDKFCISIGNGKKKFLKSEKYKLKTMKYW